MNAVQLLRTMHADTKVHFKLILGTDDAASAKHQWETLQPLLTLHEQLEDQFLYTPLFEEMGLGTPLGDWEIRHDADVAIVQELIRAASQLDPTSPEWRMAIGRVMDALNKHVNDEEGQIFGPIEEVWGPERLEEAGKKMQHLREQATAPSKLAASQSKR
jgi:hypothetical protein